MTETRRGRQQSAKQTSGMAVKITGIVFWGLAAIGLALATLMLHDLELETRHHYTMVTNELGAEIHEHLARHHIVDPHAAITTLRTLLAEHDVRAIELRVGTTRLLVGTKPQNPYELTRRIDLDGTGARPASIAYVHAYYDNLDQTMLARRKRLLVTMGVAFLLFGFTLQWILKFILTRPILRMVETAQAISDGDNTPRFDESRTDELGYLATFINKSLDYLTAQRNELADAVERVRQSETELFEEKERAVVTLHSIGDAVITTNADGTVDYLNPVAERLAGLSLDSVQGRPIGKVLQVIDEVSGEPLENPVERCLAGREEPDTPRNCALLRPDGRRIAIADSAAPIRDRKGHLIGAILVFQDVTPTRKLARQLSHQATHDVLTGLFNRLEFERQLTTALESARTEQAKHALCYLDLDQFKIVNDTCGHVAGDELLRQLAVLLQKTVRSSDVVARLGGDEIGILLKYCELEVARNVAENIRSTIKAFRFAWEDRTFEIGACVGLVAVVPDSRSVTELLSAADMACYAAKEHGRNRVHVFQAEDRELERRRGEMQWVSRITDAIDNDRFCLYYQPIVPLDGPDQPLYEVLIRMRDEDGTVIPPMAFIPAAERYGLMTAIDRWVVARTFDYASGLQVGRSPFNCTINLSGQSMGDDTFLEYVLNELQRSGAPPEQICFEITETAAVANLARATEFITTLRERGCRFALDDFGSGLSSFGYLKNLTVDFLKMDGCFVRDMISDPVNEAMVKAINQIGHVMGIRTIAEFVESPAILDALRRIGVDYAQGFHVSEPRSMDEWMEFAAEGPSNKALEQRAGGRVKAG